MTKALLTGSTGFLGKHLYKYLKENTHWEILAPVSNLVDNPPSAGDTFDYIINLASRSGVEASTVDPVGFTQNNISLMLNVLEYARKYPPKVFLQMSTVEVYNVTNIYAASKAAQEEIANAYWKTYKVPVVIARSSNIIGEGQSPEKFVPKIIQQIKNDETVNIYVNGAGHIGSRVYNPIINVCDAILYILDMYPQYYTEEANPNKQVDFPNHYDIGGGTELNNLEMAQLIAGLLNKPLNYKTLGPIEERPSYAKQLVMQGVKLEEFGWTPPEELDESLRSWIK